MAAQERTAKDGNTARPSPGFAAMLAMIGLSIVGAVALGIATMSVGPDDSLIWVSVLYFVTTTIGLLGLLAGFGILGGVLARRGDPARGWARTAMVLLAGLAVAFVVGGLVGGPGLALGVAANGLGASIGLLWGAPRPMEPSWPPVALLCGSLALILAGAIWTTQAVQSVTA